jgi:hypothetical protein
MPQQFRKGSFKENIMTKAFEVHNPDFNDMTLEQQIEAGCCDWCVEGKSGHRYYGHTARAAMQNAALYFYR